VFLLLVFALALASVPLAGGRLTRLAGLRFRGAPLIAGALALQVLIISVVPGWDSWLHDAVHLATYGLAAAFLWLNRRVPGLLLAGAGGALNFAAIAANGGVMPAREGALRTAGLEYGTGDFENSTVVEDANLAFLGDVFAIPEGWPLANVFSIGDVVLVAGVLAGLHVVGRSRLAPRARACVDIRTVEVVPASAAHALVRVEAGSAGDVVALVVEAGGGRRRIPPLPGRGHALGFGVPAALLERAPRLVLELRCGRTVALPRLAPRRPVRTSTGG
jgi:hypothetical protein